MSQTKRKPFEIRFDRIILAYKTVKANKGSHGVDGVSLVAANSRARFSRRMEWFFRLLNPLKGVIRKLEKRLRWVAILGSICYPIKIPSSRKKATLWIYLFLIYSHSHLSRGMQRQ